jgi:hypothetical protein
MRIMGHSQVNEWFRWFKEGQMTVESDEGLGRPYMSRSQLMINTVHSKMLDKRRITIREISDELGPSFGLEQSILTGDFDMTHVPVKFVPKLQTVEQKQTHLTVDRDLLQYADHDANFMKTIITSDESWVYGYDPETKAQSS